MGSVFCYSSLNGFAVNAIYHQHKQKCNHYSCCGTYCRSGSPPFCHTSICTICKVSDEHPGSNKTYCCIKDLLQNLGDRSRHHISVSLKISSVNTRIPERKMVGERICSASTALGWLLGIMICAPKRHTNATMPPTTAA